VSRAFEKSTADSAIKRSPCATRKSAFHEGRRVKCVSATTFARTRSHTCVRARELSKKQQHTHARANLRSNARVSQSRIADFSHTRFLDTVLPPFLFSPPLDRLRSVLTPYASSYRPRRPRPRRACLLGRSFLPLVIPVRLLRKGATVAQHGVVRRA